MSSPSNEIASPQNYGSVLTRRRTDIFPRNSSKRSQPHLFNRRSSEAALPSHPLSSLSDMDGGLNSAMTNTQGASHSQLTQMRDGVSLGLEGYHSKLNVLLIFVPLGILAGLFHFSALTIFILNFLGMLPLAMLLGKATEDIAEHTNDTVGAMLNVTFGNAVELILAISALRAGRLALVRDTIAGSVLSNLLLVLGSAFFFGGLRFREQIVLPAVSEANADLLSFAVFGFSIPALFAISLPDHVNKAKMEENMSLVTSICLLAIYGMYLFFQLYTHAELYEATGDVEEEEIVDDANNLENGEGDISIFGMKSPLDRTGSTGLSEDSIHIGLMNGENQGLGLPRVNEEHDDDDDGKVASLPMATGILIGAVLLVAVASEFLVDSIDGFSHVVGLGEKFIAVILLPVVSNAVEHISAILVARHNKIDLSIGIACGSSVQIALFVAPSLVMISWIFGLTHLTLNFELFETICIGFSVFVVNATLRDSRSNWLEGALLVMCYLIVGAAFYFMG